MFCPKCGTQLPDEAKFCAGCGHKLDEAVETPYQPATAAASTLEAAPATTSALTQKKKSDKPPVVIILAVLAAIAVCAVVVILVVKNVSSKKDDDFAEPSTPGVVEYQDESVEETPVAPQTQAAMPLDGKESGEIFVDGQKVNLPTKLADLIQMGWTTEKADETLECKASSEGKWSNQDGVVLKKDNAEFYASFKNLTDTDLPYSECIVFRATFELDDHVKVTVPGNFKLGDACEKELLAQWGGPDSSYKGSETQNYVYNVSDDICYEFYFNLETGVLSKIHYENRTGEKAFGSEDKVWMFNESLAKELASKDTFKVKVTSATIKQDAFSGEMFSAIQGEDKFTATIKNNSNKTITSVTLQVIGYNTDGSVFKISKPNSITIGGDPFITTMETGDDFSIYSGSSDSVSCRINSEDGAKAYVVVSEYTDSNGAIYQNPIAQEWFDAIYK